MNDKTQILRVVFAILGAVGIALLAKRKNRNVWFWGAMGTKYRCARCGNDLTNEQARSNECPACAVGTTAPST